MTPQLHRRPDEIVAFLTALLSSALAAVSAETTVRLDHIASVIVNADHSVMGTAGVHCVAESVRNFGIPQPTKGQRIAD
jgi:hypothetical protein